MQIRVTQQVFLSSSIDAYQQKCGADLDTFAKKLGVQKALLERWMLPQDHPRHKEMDHQVWSLVREILSN